MQSKTSFSLNFIFETSIDLLANSNWYFDRNQMFLFVSNHQVQRIHVDKS